MLNTRRASEVFPIRFFPFRSVSFPLLMALGLSPLAAPASLAQDRQPLLLQRSDRAARRAIGFNANRGQAPGGVLWEAKGAAFEAWFLSGSFVLRTFTARHPPGRRDSLTGNDRAGAAGAGTWMRQPAADTARGEVEVDEQVVTLVDAAPYAAIEPLEPQPGKVSFFLGNDPKRWAAGLTVYSRLAYRNIYPGIDLVFYGNRGELEYDFVVAPGADPGRIRLRMNDSAARVTANGELLAGREPGATLHRPVLYQNLDHGKRVVEGSFRVTGPDTVGFQFAEYDRRRTLVIDPAINLLYSTYASGVHNDEAWDEILDGQGNIYITGYSASQDFPVTANALQTTRGAIGTYTYNVIVMKFNSSGTLIFSTFLGGSNTALGQAIVAAPDGSVYVGGYTVGSDFPVTSNAYQKVPGGSKDAFLAKISPDGSHLVYSTYLGGSGDENIGKLMLNPDGSLWMAGLASAPGLTPSATAFQKQPNGTDNMFVAKAQFSSSGALQFPYLTFIGGSNQGEENPFYYIDLTLDSTGNVYLGASTNSGDYPVTSNAYERPFPLSGACTDSATPNSVGIVTKFSPDLSQMLYSTVIGGHTEDQNGYPDCNQSVLTIHLDAQNNIWLVGTTGMSDFPVTPNAISRQLNLTGGAGVDDFVAELSADGSTLLYGTYLGGSQFDYGGRGVWDANNNIWIVGTSQSTDFPVTSNALQPHNAGGYDVTVTELNPSGTSILYSTYLGGSGDDNYEGQGRIRLDPAGNIYLASETSSTNFPVTSNALQAVYANGDPGPDGYDVFFSILGSATVGAISPSTAGNAGDATITINGAGFQTGSTCSLVMGSATIAAASATVAANGNSIVCTFALTGAAPGSYNVVVSIPNLNPVVEQGAFTVTAGAGPNVWLSVVGRPAVRFNTPSTFMISYGNSGDADALGVTVFVIASAGVTAQYTGTLATLPAVPNLNYSQFPVSYQINGQTVIPLMLARIPAGASGSIPIQVTVPSGVTSFSLQAYNWEPFASSLAQLQMGFGTSTTPAVIEKLQERLRQPLLPMTAVILNPNAAANCINDLVQLASTLIQAAPWAQDAQCAIALAGFVGNAISTVVGAEGSSASSAGMSLAGLYAGAGQTALSCVAALAGNTPVGIIVNTILSAIQAALNAAQAINDCSQIAQPQNPQRKNGAGQGAVDPNDKSGPVGDGSASQFVQGAKGLTYDVAFENQPTATLPAAQVIVTDQLDPTKVNLATVTLSSISFGTHVFNLPSGTSSYNTTYNLNSSLSVRIQGSLNPDSGLLTWTFTSIDPSTGLPPTDPTAGFLPPDTDGVKGQGAVVFTVAPKSGLATGTVISNVATVVFDANSPIQTPTWTNTIDSTRPVSAVQPLPSTQAQIVFPVSWSGTDVGSGIATYNVYVSDNGAGFVLWQPGVTSTSATYTGQPGHTYGFYSIATDGAGNVQAAKTSADATTMVSGTASGFGLNPSSANVGSGGGSGTITVTAPSSTASWTAVDNTPAWITLTSAAGGTGNGTVGYQVAPNPGVARTGTLTIANLTFTIMEAGSITTNGLAFYPVTPCRVADTRNASGPFGGPSMSAGSTRNFAIASSACNIPTAALAYSLNVTVVPRAGLQYLTIWPTGQTQPNVSTLNSLNGAILANAAIVPAGSGGAVSVFVTDATDLVVDINGYFAPPNGAALAFYPATPCRVADTRKSNGPFGGPSLGAGGLRNFTVPASACGIPSTAQAYSLNMTAVPPAPLTYLTTWPTGQTQPNVSTLNALQGQIAANAAIVPAGTNGAISVFVSDASNAIVDINGYFAPPGNPGALYFYPVTPCRIADTRSAAGTFGGPSLGAAATRTFPIASSACNLPFTAQAYSLNMTAVPTGSLLYLSAWPAGQPQPVVSTLNDLQGQIVANAAIVPAGAGSFAGSISVFVSDATNLVIDINGYFAQ